jgi:pyrroloquinoline quinone biosynthesis protein B
MRILILGAGAGGGVPQWNSNNKFSQAAFRNDPAAQRLTQCGLAVSVDNRTWVLLNASPDLRQQIIATPALHPTGSELRTSPIAAVLLTNADIDAIAGLLTMRERHAFSLFASSTVLDTLQANSIFDALDPALVQRSAIEPDRPFDPVPGLSVTAFKAPGKPPLYLERSHGHAVSASTANTVGFILHETGSNRTMAFIPGCGEITPDLKTRLADVSMLFFGGTLFTDDEMIASGEGQKTGRRMGHVPMTGPGGAVDALRDLPIPRRYFIHINNTNPALHRDSPARRTLLDHGWRIAEDGMELEL